MEKKVDWGDSRHWTQTDFEALSERILAETNVSLSPSTLKRLWGRVTYTSVPQATTLNTLARFVGYASYRDFERTHQPSEQDIVVPPSHPEHTAANDTPRKRVLANGSLWSIGLVMGFLLSLLLAFSLSRPAKEDTAVDPTQYSFSSRPVSTGIPNSVVFTFNVSSAKTDCLHVQQSWDERLRFRIKKDQQQATSIYYCPGFFRAKLVVDSVVVKEHDLYIQTSDWLPLVEQEPVPVYFTAEESVRDGALGLSVEQLRSRNISLQPEVPWVSYYYVRKMNGLMSQNFTLETSLRNTFSTGSGACQHSYLGVLFKNSALAIPLSIPGCTSAVDAFIAGELLEGSKTDLSALGVDFSRWAKLRLTVEDKTVQVLLNEQPVLESTFSLNAGEIIGIVYRFQGTGSVDYLRLYDGEGTIRFREEY